MLEPYVNLACDVCMVRFSQTPWPDTEPTLPNADDRIMRAAEANGWLVQRKVKDISYGAAMCATCRTVMGRGPESQNGSPLC